MKEDYGGAVKQPDTEVIMITITYAWQIIKIYLLMNASSVIVLVLEIFFYKFTTYCKKRKEVAHFLEPMKEEEVELQPKADEGVPDVEECEIQRMVDEGEVKYSIWKLSSQASALREETI